jgi:hypothetical protein
VLANGRSCSQSLPMSVGAGFSETNLSDERRRVWLEQDV